MLPAAAGIERVTACFYPLNFKLFSVWRNFPHTLNHFESLVVKVVLGILALG